MTWDLGLPDISHHDSFQWCLDSREWRVNLPQEAAPLLLLPAQSIMEQPSTLGKTREGKRRDRGLGVQTLEALQLALGLDNSATEGHGQGTPAPVSCCPYLE